MNTNTINTTTTADTTTHDPMHALRVWTAIVGVPANVDHLGGAWVDVLGGLEFNIERLYSPAREFRDWFVQQPVMLWEHSRLNGCAWADHALRQIKAHITKHGEDVALVDGEWAPLPVRAERMFAALERFLLALGVVPHRYPARWANWAHVVAAVDVAGDPALRRALLGKTPAHFGRWLERDDLSIYEATVRAEEDGEDDPEGWRVAVLARVAGVPAWSGLALN